MDCNNDYKKEGKKRKSNGDSMDELRKESETVKEPQVFVFGSSTERETESSAFNFKGGNGCSEVMLEMREKSLRDKEEAFHKKQIEFEEKLKSFDTKVIEMEKEKKQMEEELKENKDKMKKLFSELRSRVYCPVCLSVPTQGPVFVCPNGHTVCSTCKTTNCSICRTKMWDNTSLLAVTVINNIDHQCPYQFCAKEVPLPDLEEHKKTCEHKPICCPSVSCSVSVATSRLLDHLIMDCKYSRGSWMEIGSDNVICEEFTVPDRCEEWMDVFQWEGKFLVLLVRYSDTMETSLSVLMLEENLSRYKVELTVKNTVKDMTLQDGISYSFKGQPNPITIENKDDLVGLYLNKKSFDRVTTKSLGKVSWIVQLAIEEKAVVQVSHD